MKFRCVSCGWSSGTPVMRCDECGRTDPFQQKFISKLKWIAFVIFLIMITIWSWNA